MKKNFGRIFWGICVLILGVALILYATGVIETVFFAGWWSLFLILPGIAMLCKRGCRAGGVVLVLLGLYFLLKEQNIISFGLSWPLVLGILLIYAGIVVLFGWLFHPKARPARAQETTFFQNGSVDFHDKPSYDAVFSRCDVTNSSKALKEAGGNAVFGQLNLDFSGVQASGNPAISLNAVFGKVTILLPSNIRLVVNASPVFGGVKNGASPSEDPNLPLFTVDAAAVFGEVEILSK